MTPGAPNFVVKDGALSWPEIAGMRERIYPPEQLVDTPMHGIEWSHAQRRILLYIDDVVRAVAGIHERVVLCDGQKIAVAGVGGVMTEPEFQGQGLGKLVMLHLVDLLKKEANCAFSLLFCEDHNVGFYAKMGWLRFAGDLVVEQHGRSGPFAFRNTMVLPVTKPAQVTGHIDLCGLPW